MKRPTLLTDRLFLRPFTLADAPDVQRLAGDRDIASSTLNIPHPYEDGMAEQWIGTHQEKFDRGELVNFAITRRQDGVLQTINFRTPVIRTPEDANPAVFREREETGPIFVKGIEPGDVLANHRLCWRGSSRLQPWRGNASPFLKKARVLEKSS